MGVLLILSQSPALFGYEAEGSNAILTFWDTFTNIGEWNWSAVFIGAITLGLMIGLRKTPLKTFASALALLISSLIVYFFGFDSVQIVQDISTIPGGLPELSIPQLSIITPQLIFSSFTMAIVIAIQGLGVSQMAENPDGSPVNASRDMVAQGAASVATGLFSGIPVGGSVGSTALNMTLGAKSRLASVLSGLWMIAIVLLFAPLVEQVPMPALTALIMMAGIGAVNVKDAISILKSGWPSIVGFSVTMICILLFSIPIAVAVGVVLTILIHFIKSANEIEIVHLKRDGKGNVSVNPLPDEIPSGDPMVISVEGTLFFAGAQTLLERLPKVGKAKNPVVVLRIRNQSQMGATLIDVLDEYAEGLEAAGGKLYLSGLEEDQKGGHREPTIISYPPMIEGDSISEQMIAHSDIYRTLADILSIDIDNDMAEDSISNLSLWKGDDAPIREDIVHSSGVGGFSIRRDFWKLNLVKNGGGMQMIKELQEGKNNDELFKATELYDLRDDISETNNIINEHPEVVEELKNALAEYIRSGRSTEGEDQPFANSRYDGTWPQIGWMENSEEIINPKSDKTNDNE